MQVALETEEPNPVGCHLQLTQMHSRYAQPKADEVLPSHGRFIHTCRQDSAQPEAGSHQQDGTRGDDANTGSRLQQTHLSFAPTSKAPSQVPTDNTDKVRGISPTNEIYTAYWDSAQDEWDKLCAKQLSLTTATKQSQSLLPSQDTASGISK